MKSRQVREILGRYSNRLSFIDKAHIYFRLRQTKFDKIAKFIPKSSQILDFGCGHGFFSLYLNQIYPKSKIVAADISSKKIKIAQTAKYSNSLKFIHLNNPAKLLKKSYSFNVIVILNVLYLLPQRIQIALIDKISRVLPNKGKFILVEYYTSRPFSLFFTKVREFIMIKILRLTFGDHLTFHSHQWWLGILKQRFTKVKTYYLDKYKSQKLYICIK